jgi:hypothetical protein
LIYKNPLIDLVKAPMLNKKHLKDQTKKDRGPCIAIKIVSIAWWTSSSTSIRGMEAADPKYNNRSTSWR